MSADSIEKIADDSLAEFYKQVTDSAPLMDRLKEARERIGKMCSERRGPRMSIPVQWYDDDVFICKTIEDAIDALPSAELERDAIRFAAVKPENYTSLDEWRAAVDAAVEAEHGTKLRHTCGEQASCAPCEEEDRLAARAIEAKR